MTATRRLAIILGVVAGLTIGASVALKHYEATARQRFIAALSKKFDGDVTLGQLHLALFPSVQASGDSLVVRFRERPDLPPLIEIARFSASADLLAMLRSPGHIRLVRLEGLRLRVPPKEARPVQPASQQDAHADFIVDEVIADGAVLQTLPRDSAKLPLTFRIRHLILTSVGKTSELAFHAELDNAKPPGLIVSEGQIGPWTSKTPADTPLWGKYTFRDADLSVFKGISGKLASDGKYEGHLGSMEVQGTADVPDFALEVAHHPMHLQTQFQATVDGTDGDTVLHPVKAVLGDSTFEVSGSIERGALEHGKEINLDTKSVQVRLEDFLTLAVRSPKPPMRGVLEYTSKIRIPARQGAVVEKLDLNGSFATRNVVFTDPGVEAKMASLSHHAEGQPKATGTAGVQAAFRGKFILDEGILSLPNLAFELPGAEIALNGKYGLRTGALDFKGVARLDATVSQMTTGIKRILLKPVDPLFRHGDAGTVLPIVIGGTVGGPSFRLDIGKVLRRKD